mgnify:CR=1 FL=1
MPATKDQLKAQSLMDRGMRRLQDPDTKRFSVVASDVDKTPLMLYTEGVTGKRIDEILLMQMSTHRLAEWLSHQIGRRVTQPTIHNWRKRFNIKRIRRAP